MTVQYGRLKCDFKLNLDESLVTFLMVFDIFNDESVDSIIKNKKNGEDKMADEKLNLNINFCKIRCLGVPDITD